MKRFLINHVTGSVVGGAIPYTIVYAFGSTYNDKKKETIQDFAIMPAMLGALSGLIIGRNHPYILSTAIIIDTAVCILFAAGTA